MVRRSKSAETIPPNPADLISSIRGFGYTLPTALADLVDNAITAAARRVDITIEHASSAPFIAVCDDGNGMTEKALVEAMRFGTLGPSAIRASEDLGRFGLGMKTASLSHGRSLTVITRSPSSKKPHFRRWDLDHVEVAGTWSLTAELSPTGQQYLERLAQRPTGTVVIIEKLDRASFLEVPQSQRNAHLAVVLNAIRLHLGMVFHRFISEDSVEIRLGESKIPAWDPYLRGNSKQLPTETLHLGTGSVIVTPYVLPHHSRLTDDQHTLAGGPLGWNKHQGFFIYRCRRLVIPGDWLNVGLVQEEHYKLARIQVDLPNTMDEEWHLNVVKSHVAAPARIRDDLKRIANDVRRAASAVYRVRGEREAPEEASAHHPVWRREKTRSGVRFRIDRGNPAIRAILHSGCSHDAGVAGLLNMIEEALPVAAILQEPRKSLDGLGVQFTDEDLNALVDIARHAEQYYCRTGKTLAEARALVLGAEPFVRAREALSERLSLPTS